MNRESEMTCLFDANGIAWTVHEHEAVYTVEESARIHAEIAGAHTKNLFLKDAKDRLWLISAQDTTVIELKRLHPVIGSARLSFGSASLMEETLGVTPGSVTAFALINDPAHRVSFVLDRNLAQAERVNFHPLTNTATTGVSRAGFRRFLESVDVAPLVVDFETLTVVSGYGAP